MNKNFRSRQSPGLITGAKVTVKNDDVNGALRRLKKILDNNNRQKDLSKHEFYEKPSIRKKRARDQAKKRTNKEQSTNILDAATNNPTGTKWMKSKRKRRRVLDKQNALSNYIRKQNRNRGQ